MLEKIITLLQWIDSTEKPKKYIDWFFSFGIMAISLFIIYKLLWIIFDYNEYLMSHIPLNIFIGDASFFENIGSFIVLFIFLIFITLLYFYGIYFKLTRKNFSLVRVILNGILPLVTGVVFVAFYIADSMSIKWYIIIFGGLYALSPFFLFLSLFNRINTGIMRIILDSLKKYTVIFLIGIILIGMPIYFDKNLSGQYYVGIFDFLISQFILIFNYGIIAWFILTYAWMELEGVSEILWKKILRNGVILATIFLIIFYFPDFKSFWIENRISVAQSILEKEGETKEGLEDASNVWFLKWSLKEKFLMRTLFVKEKELYSKLFDTPIEDAVSEEVNANKYRSQNSNATSILSKGENAKVVLDFAKYESVIFSDIRAIKTTVTYEFQNTTTENQEIIFNIALPDTESTMTDLHLGTNLQYIGIIAPRGAANKVYQDSLRQNSDPALLEQTGPLSYRLRVFPIPSFNDTSTQGKQKIQFTYISPLKKDGIVTIIPKTDSLNLKLTKKSEIITRVIEGEKVLVQDSKSSSNLDEFLQERIEKIDIFSEKEYTDYCSVNSYSGINMSEFSSIKKDISKNIVFLDISKSVAEKSSIKKQYQSLIDAWKKTGVSLDIYTYNFDVYQNGYNLDIVDFWGMTDMAKVINFIDKNNISNANIVIITDDISYEIANEEIKTIDYKKLKTNKISLIQIGDKIRTLKPEITKSIFATNGLMVSIDEKSNIPDSIKNIFIPDKVVDTCDNYNGENRISLSFLQGYREGKNVFGETLMIYEQIPDKYTRPVYLPAGSYTFKKPTNNAANLATESYVPRTLIYDLNGDNGGSLYQIPKNDTVITRVGSTESGDIGGVNQILTKDGIVIFDIKEDGYYMMGKTGIEKTDSTPKPVFLKNSTKQSDLEILQKIATHTHIVTQSTSLIALEGELQKQSLAIYSQNENKYEQRYENFTADAILGETIGSSELFGHGDITKGFSVSTASINESRFDFGLIRYVIAFILFPLFIGFLLRKKVKLMPEIIKDNQI